MKGLYHHARLGTAFLIIAFFVGVKFYLIVWYCEMCVWALSISWHVTPKMFGISNEFLLYLLSIVRLIWVFQGGEEQKLTRLSLDSSIIIYAYLVRPPFEAQKIEFGEILDSSTWGGGS